MIADCIRILLIGWLLIGLPHYSSAQRKKKDKEELFLNEAFIEKYKYKAAHHIDKIDLPEIDSKKAKNIILMIGDGMGTSQIYAGLVANKGKLYLEYLPNIGFIKTYSADDLITDSAAGATAFATGKKTNNGMIGMGPDNQPLSAITEMVEQKGLSTGLVATSTITHATPAAFVAHEFSRHYYEQIAADFLRDDIDVFIGGGRSHFTNRLDRLNLLEVLKERNYTVIDTILDLDAAQGDKLAGLLYYDSPPSIIEGRGDMLARAAKKSLEILSKNEKGFFMVVEGSQIDWGNHQNNILYQTEEMLDFDSAIGAVLEFAARDRETLVIITADHETGGLAISGGDMKKGIVFGDYTTNGHTGVMVPVFAYGPSAELFKGIFENTEIYTKMLQAFDLDPSKP
jgi:alkaline phosphatase